MICCGVARNQRRSSATAIALCPSCDRRSDRSAMPMITRGVVRLMRRPQGDVKPGEDLVHSTEAFDLQVAPDEVAIENMYLSLDPAMRGWMDDRPSYLPPVKLGAVMRGSCVGRVVASAAPDVPVGSLVSHVGGWTTHAKLKRKHIEVLPPGSDPKAALSVLGGTGLTAYFGLLRIGRPKKGEVVVVSAAAGATGSVVAQIAKHVIGCTVIGIAKGQEKVQVLRDLGCDVALDRGSKDHLKELDRTLKEAGGVDVYFDNVGGPTLDACLRRLKNFGRVVCCGAISQYNSEPAPIYAAANLVVRRGTMQGFIVMDYATEYDTARADLAKWLASGQVKNRVSVFSGGLGKAPDILLELFKGANVGKLLVEISSSAKL